MHCRSRVIGVVLTGLLGDGAAGLLAVHRRSTDFTCPECSGAIREIADEPIQRFRCRVGHAYNAEEFVQAKSFSVEEALWMALQSLQEQAQVFESLAASDRRRGWVRNAASYEKRAGEVRAAANRLRELVMALAA